MSALFQKPFVIERFDSRGGGLKVGIPLDGVFNKRGQLRVVEGEDPARHDGAAAMRAGPVPQNLRASPFRHDLFANGCLPNRATDERQATGGSKKQGGRQGVDPFHPHP